MFIRVIIALWLNSKFYSLENGKHDKKTKAWKKKIKPLQKNLKIKKTQFLNIPELTAASPEPRSNAKKNCGQTK